MSQKWDRVWFTIAVFLLLSIPFIKEARCEETAPPAPMFKLNKDVKIDVDSRRIGPTIVMVKYDYEEAKLFCNKSAEPGDVIYKADLRFYIDHESKEISYTVGVWKYTYKKEVSIMERWAFVSVDNGKSLHEKVYLYSESYIDTCKAKRTPLVIKTKNTTEDDLLYAEIILEALKTLFEQQKKLGRSL